MRYINDYSGGRTKLQNAQDGWGDSKLRIASWCSFAQALHLQCHADWAVMLVIYPVLIGAGLSVLE